MVQAFLKNGRRRTRRKDEVSESRRGVVTLEEPISPASEAYRGLRTNLLYTRLDDPPRVVVLTSPGPGEGKSTTCANLGVVLAQAAKSTLILDCDLRKPVVHKFFGLRNFEGIIDVLVGDRRLQEVWKQPVEGLKVVPVGPVPPNPAEILGSQRFSAFLASARKEFDYVLIDASPIGVVYDPAVLAAQADGVLLVLDAENTRKGPLLESMRTLEGVGANILGSVMNNVEISKEGYRYYGYT